MIATIFQLEREAGCGPSVSEGLGQCGRDVPGGTQWLALKERSSAQHLQPTAFASSMRPSLANAAANRLRDRLKLGMDCTARRAACAASQ